MTSTIVAEGSAKVTAKGIELTPAEGRPALVALGEGPEALDVSSANGTFAGSLVAIGGAGVSGSGHVFSCGIYAHTISISGGANKFAACRVDDL